MMHFAVKSAIVNLQAKTRLGDSEPQKTARKISW